MHALSAATGEGLEALDHYVERGKTVALVGSSGVGKSTLINRLLGRDALAVSEIRARDDRGRHTTSHRELLLLPGGGLLIDNPGMRELQLWDAEAGLAETFADIRSWARACRFRDCCHEEEPGCAVRRALEAGKLSGDRLHSFQKLRQEQESLATRLDPVAARLEKQKTKKIHKALRKDLKRS